MRVLAVFLHTDSCCVSDLNWVLYDLLFLCFFYFFSVYRSGLCDTQWLVQTLLYFCMPVSAVVMICLYAVIGSNQINK